jgi:MraZ protein
MASERPKRPILYTGYFPMKVDDARRVPIPAKWRESGGGGEHWFNVVVWDQNALSEPCLLVLPPAQVEAISRKIDPMSFTDPHEQTLAREMGTNSETVTVDKIGRIMLPEWMTKAAQIDREAVFAGVWNRFEIWSPQRYERLKSLTKSLRPEAFKKI